MSLVYLGLHKFHFLDRHFMFVFNVTDINVSDVRLKVRLGALSMCKHPLRGYRLCLGFGELAVPIYCIRFGLFHKIP